MPFRFRRSFKIFPGLKINLSKSGISTTIGKRGASLNFGKRGAKLTTGIPGTGISHTTNLTSSAASPTPTKPRSVHAVNVPSGNRPKPLIKIPMSFMIGAGVLAFICQSVFCVSVITTPSSTSTPTLDMKVINDRAMETAWGFYTQTAAALPTNTEVPTTTPPPPTETETPQPTATLIVVPTATLFIVVQPTQEVQSAVCSCSGDNLNCSDFGSHSSAQACFNYCVAQGRGDIHGLDRDNNGSACESLP